MTSPPDLSGPDRRSLPRSVLVLGNYRQTLTVIRSLARAGFRVILGTHDGSAPGIRSRYVSMVWKHPPIVSDEESFLASLKNFVMGRPDISWVFPVGENQLLCLASHLGEIPFRSRVVMADPAVALLCLDKTKLYRVASELEIPFPELRNVRDVVELYSAAESIGYPCVIKPNCSRGLFFERKAMIFGTRDDLRNFIGSWPEGNDSLIVQRYVSGPRINCHFAARNGKLEAYFEYVTLWTNRHDDTGIAVEGISSRKTAKLEEYSQRLVGKLGYTGVGCIQFLNEEKSKQSFFLELNPRLSATTAFPFHLGFDTPMMAVECAARREDRVPEAIGNGRTYPIGKRVQWLLGDLEGLVTAIKHRDVNPFQALHWMWRMAKAFVRADVHVTWSWRDPLPTGVMYMKLASRIWHSLARSKEGTSE